MSDPVIALSTSAIVTLATQKLIESSAGELGKKFTVTAIEKMDELRQKIWDKLRGKSSRVDEALANAQNGDSTALGTVAKYLDVAMEEDSDFAAEVQAVAQIIHAGRLLDQSTMTQINQDNAKGWQTKVEGGVAYIGEIYIQQKLPNS
jgi:hypothetical protein